MRKLVRDLKRARLALGDGVKRRFTSENQPLLKQEKHLVDGVMVIDGQQR
jgi:N-acetylneuraminate synthase/sialic acid synthase